MRSLIQTSITESYAEKLSPWQLQKLDQFSEFK